MTNTDLGACEVFIYELRRSSLIERGQIDQVVEDFLKRNPRAVPATLAEHLVAQNVLTRFQAERVMQGKTQGLVLGPYVLTHAIGQGSMGTVHKAISKNDNKTYAVKVLPRRSMWNVRLARRQVRAFGQFSHPTVVPFVDVGTSGGLHYLVWAFVDGETLDAIVQRKGRLDPASTAALGLHIATGLNLAHQNGLFHGLIKPSNVMVSPGQVRLLDFGIGSLLAENEGESLVDTMSTANALTSGLDCSSPESIMEPTNRTPAGDQYSLGCVLYYCLTGHYPFPEGSAVEKMMAHQFKQPTPVTELAPDTPAELAEIIEKLMQKKPEERFVGVDETVEALHPLAGRLSREFSLNAPAPRPAAPAHSTAAPPARSTAAPPAHSTAAAQKSAFNFRSAPLVGTPLPVGSGFTPPPPGVAALTPPPVLPTRRSMRGESATPIPTPAASAPARAPARPVVPALAHVPPPVRTPFQAPPQNLIEPAQPPDHKPSLGPIGFLALGATVAVICYLAVHTLMK